MIDLSKISSKLELKNNIWYSKGNAQISYPEDGNDLCFQIEDKSFWFKHRNNCILELVKIFFGGGIFLDVGGGNGIITITLQNAGYSAVLVEPGSGIKNAQTRGVENIACTTLENAQFQLNSISGIGIFDVLEHIEDDVSFLQLLNRHLEKKGSLFITVPAYSYLWSEEDKNAGHYRRYSLSSLTKKLVLANFEIKYKTYFFSFLPIPIFIKRTLKINRDRSKTPDLGIYSRLHTQRTGIVRKSVDSILKWELNNIKNTRQILFGSSCLIVAEKIIKSPIL